MVDKALLDAIQGLLLQQKGEILEETAQNVQELLSQQKSEILEETAKNMQTMESRILEKTDQNMQTALQAAESRISDECHRNMMMIVEAQIEPQLRILAEAYEGMVEKLTPTERVEAIEDDVSVLKTAVRHMNKDISNLKKAQ